MDLLNLTLLKVNRILIKMDLIICLLKTCAMLLLGKNVSLNIFIEEELIG